jgi:hypothetical protein
VAQDDYDEEEDDDESEITAPKNLEVPKASPKNVRSSAHVEEEEEYEEMIHPNLEKEEEEPRAITYLMPNGAEPGSWADSNFVKWFSVFDEQTLRPFFIRNYDVVTALIEDEYQDMLQAKFDDKDEARVLEQVETIKRTMSTLQQV